MTNTSLSALALSLSLGLAPFSLTQVEGCDSSTADEDQDGYTVGDGDCDDLDASVYPSAPELCDGLDNDCDGAVDDQPTQMVYPDADHDGYGSPTGGIQACPAPSGYAASNTDCNDQDSSTYPGASDACDGIDKSCSGPAKEERNVLVFRDADADGYGDALHPTLLRSCDATTGYASVLGDCDDTVSSTRPNKVESCNGLDDNCDGQSDEGLSLTYVDADGDGFGTDASASCSGGTNRVKVHGDCNDGASSVHPGAVDSGSDSVDTDCGGTTAQELHVGYTSSPTLTLQQALDQAASNTTIWVNAGTYEVASLNFNGKKVSLRASHGPAETTLDAKSTARAVLFNHAETSASRLEGFRVVNGKADMGGAIFVDAASPTLENCRVETSTAIQGGGIALKNSNAVMQGLTLKQNTATLTCIQTEPAGDGYYQTWDFSCDAATGLGGGLYIVGGAPSLQTVRLESNQTPQSCGESGYWDAGGYSADYAECYYGAGGGLWVESSQLTASGLVAVGNKAGHGGGVGAKGGTLSLTGLVLTRNEALASSVVHNGSSHSYYYYSTTYTGGKGGGLYALQTTLSVVDASFLSNTSAGQGGGAALYSSAVQGSDLLAMGNVSTGKTDTNTNTLIDFNDTNNTSTFHDGDGGGLALINSSATLDTLSLLGNTANRGGGLYAAADGSSTPLTLNHGMVAGNLGQGAYNGSSVCSSTCNYADTPKASMGAGVYVSASGSKLSSLDFNSNLGRGIEVSHANTTSAPVMAGGQGSAAYLSGTSLSFSSATRNTAAVGCVDMSSGLDVCDIGKGTVMSVGGSLSHLILGYNEGSNLKTSGSVGLEYSDLYPTARCFVTSTGTQCDVNTDLASLPVTNLTVAPGFSSLDASGRPVDSHLSSSSTLIGKGSASFKDPDGSTCDMGVFSGPDAHQLDADLDGMPGWYWTGSYASAPAGVNASLFDADDLNAGVK